MSQKRKMTGKVTKRHIRRIIQSRTLNDLDKIDVHSQLVDEEPLSTTDESELSSVHNESDSIVYTPEHTLDGDIFDANLNIDNNSGMSTSSLSLNSMPDNDGVDRGTNSCDNNSSDNSELNDDNRCEKFKSAIVSWALGCNVPHSTCNALLDILRQYTDCNFPKDARTLLRTSRKTNVTQIQGGSYYHFGLSGIIERMLNDCEEVENIDLLVNIDGLPLSKSSNASLWPILCSNTINKKVYIVGAYFGYKKPEDSNEFLQQLVNDLVIAINNGYPKNGKQVKIRLHALICDAPAKSFALLVKSHTGFHSCTKCTIEGQYQSSRVCFPGDGNNNCLRTDVQFALNVYEDYQFGYSILNTIPHFGLVTNVPLDYLHLLCLGVIKKMILLWLQGPLSVRLSTRLVKKISDLLLSFQNTMPNDFARRPRSLKDVRQWKATEFRNFLLYTGPLVLKNVLKREVYNHFMTLHVAVTILVSSSLCQGSNIDYAEALLKHFVTSFGIIYGDQYVSHNVHNLLHLCSDVRKFGPLDTFSAFRFENYMSSIKKVLRKSDKPLQQLVRRYSEIDRFEFASVRSDSVDSEFCFTNQHCDGPLVDVRNVQTQYKMMSNNLFCIKWSSGRDNYCTLKNGTLVIVENIIKANDNLMYIVGREMKQLGISLYRLPCDSMRFDIHIVSIDNPRLYRWPVSEVKYKLWKLPYESNHVVFPIIHTK